MADQLDRLGRFHAWAKTDDKGRPALSVRDHCIYVGMVAALLLDRFPPAMRTLFPAGDLILIAAHDIGKISPDFLMKSPLWRAHWQSRLGLMSLGMPGASHASISHAYLAEKCPFRTDLLISIGGHHGTYGKQNIYYGPSDSVCVQWPTVQRHRELDVYRDEVLAELCEIFGPLSDIQKMEKNKKTEPLIHWFTGFMIFCDWIGSNTNWFPLDLPKCTAGEAKRLACIAVDALKWHCREVRRGQTFTSLFSFGPRPLQSALQEIIDAPGLYIVEAPMGEGKTEAALMAAYQRWSQGDERGIYFALPTQLTSNRIHERIDSFLEKAISDASVLTLVHSAAWLSDQQVQSISPSERKDPTDPKQMKEEACRWFSGHRCSLLAPFGVGTIDQALLAVLCVRFSALRLFALSGKVIVFDEVHSYDPYTSTLINITVRWLLAVKCTVIILSATLSIQRRKELLKAAGVNDSDDSLMNGTHYPLITKVAAGQDSATTYPIKIAENAEKTFQLEFSSDWLQEAIQAAESGACVLIIRNTVALAQGTYLQLKSSCRDVGIEFGLIHSRFAQFERDLHEGRWIQLLGKDQEFRPKNGVILVGTQVVEQSVDIDADLLITDLAPVDLILQRLGRLHRHVRPRPVGYKWPRCLVIDQSIDWNAPDEEEIRKALSPSAYIYPPLMLYTAHSVLANTQVLHIPNDIRSLIEKANTIPEMGVPSAIKVFMKEYQEQKDCAVNDANGRKIFKTVTLNDQDDDSVSTRWTKQKSGYFVLLRKEIHKTAESITLHTFDRIEKTFKSDVFGRETAKQLHRNAVRVPWFILQDLDRLRPELDRYLKRATFLVVHPDSTSCVPFSKKEGGLTFTYSSELGLQYQKQVQIKPTDIDKESFWF